jgi:hypothetical protein
MTENKAATGVGRGPRAVAAPMELGANMIPPKVEAGGPFRPARRLAANIITVWVVARKTMTL